MVWKRKKWSTCLKLWRILVTIQRGLNVMSRSMARKKIIFIWLSGSLVLMLITSCISMVVWNFSYQQEANIDWKPINQIIGMISLVPVGWLFSFMTLFGWVNIVFMCAGVYTRLPYLLIGSAIATILTGIWWPMTYVTMLNIQAQNIPTIVPWHKWTWLPSNFSLFDFRDPVIPDLTRNLVKTASTDESPQWTKTAAEFQW